MNNSDSIRDTLNQWHQNIIKQSSLPLMDNNKQDIKVMFENLDFSNVYVHEDGRADGEKDGNKYSGMYLSGVDNHRRNDVVSVQNVKFNNKNS